MNTKQKSIEMRLHKNRMRKTAIMSGLILAVTCALIFGIWYTLSNISDNPIVSTVYCTIISILSCVIIVFLYKQIPADAYDQEYNTSLLEMRNRLYTSVEIYKQHAINDAKEKGINRVVYFQIEEVEKELQ